jgi:hypothetical protein
MATMASGNRRWRNDVIRNPLSIPILRGAK